MEGTSQGGEGGFQFIKLDGLAKTIGASDAGIRFLLALLSGNVLISFDSRKERNIFKFIIFCDTQVGGDDNTTTQADKGLH